jgi:hypothetical protein
MATEDMARVWVQRARSECDTFLDNVHLYGPDELVAQVNDLITGLLRGMIDPLSAEGDWTRPYVQTLWFLSVRLAAEADKVDSAWHDILMICVRNYSALDG